MGPTDFVSDLHASDRTIVFVDVVESVRLTEHDERNAVRSIRQLLCRCMEEVVPTHHGRVIERVGDGLLLDFPDPAAAAGCSFLLHQAAVEQNVGIPASEQLFLRIGIHRADVLTDAASLYGHGVNLASRLTALAPAGETYVSAQAAGQLAGGLDGDLTDLGERFVKHVAAPLRVYRLGPPQRGSDVGQPRLVDLRPTVAVLPFHSYDSATHALGVGDIIADQVIGSLSRSNEINVISRLSTSGFRRREIGVVEIGAKLRATYVVSGRYWNSSSGIVTNVELAEALTGKVMWSTTLAGEESSLTTPDSNFVIELVSGITKSIFASEVRLVRSVALPNLESHTLLLAAISLLYRLSRDDFERSRAALEILHERAPRHPDPLAWLARWHLFRVVQSWSDDRERDGQMALAYANRALDLDPESSLSLTMAGNVHTNFLKDLDGAERLYKQALQINPNESLAWLQRGNALSFRGEGDAALASIEKAVSLSPLDPSRHFYQSILASAALTAGDWARAVEAAHVSLRLNRDHVSTHRVLAIAQVMLGRVDEASQTVRRILQLEPQLTVASFVARSPGARSGLAKTFGKALQAAGLPLGDF